MKSDKDRIDISAVEDHDGILTIRGGGAQRDWNGIHYKQGMSGKNVGTTSLSANIATIPPGGVAYVSTPNLLTLAPPGAEKSDNPWHVREYRAAEFRELCEAHFERVELLEQIEASIQARELELAELERQLADDWGNTETLAAHTAARKELTQLLERWEQLFEAAQQV